MALKVEIEKGIYGEDFVFTLEMREDFEVYEEVLKRMNIFEINRKNFYEFKADFDKYIDKELIYEEKKYCIIGMEDNHAFADWYWIAQNIEDESIEYILCNDSELYNCFIN